MKPTLTVLTALLLAPLAFAESTGDARDVRVVRSAEPSVVFEEKFEQPLSPDWWGRWPASTTTSAFPPACMTAAKTPSASGPTPWDRSLPT
jgi:hypothetical protein